MTLFSTSRPRITVKALPRFPANVTADGGLSITKTDGTYNFGFDYSTQTLNTNLATPANWTMLAYNSGTGLYEQVRLDAVVDYTIQTRRAIGDQNETLTSNDRYVALTASLSTTRTWTLPAANSVTAGVVIRFQDEVGGVSGSNTLTFARSGSDTINGATSKVLNRAYIGASFISNGTDAWSYEVALEAASISGLSIASGKTFTVSNTLTLTGTDSSSVAFGTGGTVAYTANKLSAFAATTSAELAGVISNETGSGSLVFGTSPTLEKPVLANVSLSSPAVAGELEYDNKVAYVSPVASNRGVIPAEHFVILTSGNTLTSTTSPQAMFDGGGGPANGAITLPVGTYFFEILAYLSSLSGSSGDVSFGFGGTSTVVGRYHCIAVKGTETRTFQSDLTENSITATNTTTTANFHIRGLMVVTVTGTVIPRVALGVAAAASVGQYSFFRCHCVGSDSVATVGNWS